MAMMIGSKVQVTSDFTGGIGQSVSGRRGIVSAIHDGAVHALESAAFEIPTLYVSVILDGDTQPILFNPAELQIVDEDNAS